MRLDDQKTIGLENDDDIGSPVGLLFACAGPKQG